MFVRAVDDKPSDTLVVVSGEGFWTGSSTLPHLHHVLPLPIALAVASSASTSAPDRCPSGSPIGGLVSSATSPRGADMETKNLDAYGHDPLPWSRAAKLLDTPEGPGPGRTHWLGRRDPTGGPTSPPSVRSGRTGGSYSRRVDSGEWDSAPEPRSRRLRPRTPAVRSPRRSRASLRALDGRRLGRPRARQGPASAQLAPCPDDATGSRRRASRRRCCPGPTRPAPTVELLGEPPVRPASGPHPSEPLRRPRQRVPMDTRADWEQALRHEDLRFARYGRPVALLVVEIRPTEDAAVDDVARRVGEIVRDHARAPDRVARVSQRRFHVLCRRPTRPLR